MSISPRIWILLIFWPQSSNTLKNWSRNTFFVVFGTQQAQLTSGKHMIAPPVRIHWSDDESLLGPIKGVFPTPDTGPFFQSDTDIHTKISVGRHRIPLKVCCGTRILSHGHSELSARHSTLHFTPTLTFLFPSWHWTFPKNSSRPPTFRPPFMGPSIDIAFMMAQGICPEV